MSWNIHALLVQVETPEKSYKTFISKLGIGEPTLREKASFDAAIDSITDVYDGVAIGSAEGWTSVWGEPSRLIVGETELTELSKKSKAYFFMMSGFSETYYFEAWVDGSQRRKRICQAGEVFNEHGEPLPQEVLEYAETDDEEDRMFGLMDRLTVPHRRLTKPKFHVFDLEE